MNTYTDESTHKKQTIIGTVVSLIIFLLFVIWSEADPDGLPAWSREDGVFEYLTAIFFGLAGIGFFVAFKRSEFLKSKKDFWPYLFVIGWGLLLLVFMGEEISWGQRIFGFETPQSILDVNDQNEFNFHNYEFFRTVSFAARSLSLMMLVIGIIFPILGATKKGIQLIQRFSFPVIPLGYAAIFILSFIYGKYYGNYDILPMDASSEIREFIFALGILAFGVHAALWPDDLFRWRKEKVS